MFLRLFVFTVILTNCFSIVYAQTEKTFSEESKELDAESSKQVPKKVLEAGKKGTEELIAAGIVKKALNVGDKMPAFTLFDANGKQISSEVLSKKGHLVITFYRGAWCPFCNLYLRSLQKQVPKFKELGANLVAISIEPPDRSLDVSQQNKLNFTVLSDPKLEVSRKFGIVYEMPKVVNDAVLELGFDIAKYNGMEKAELPLSATYVIDKKGKIVYAFLDPDYKKRAEPSEMISVLKELSSDKARGGLGTADIEAIKQIEETYRTAWLKNDEKTILSLFADDAMLYPNGNAPVKGKDEMRKFWFAASDTVTTINTYETKIDEIYGEKNLAYVVGSNELRWSTEKKDKTELKRFASKGYFIGIYVKRDRQWKILKQYWTGKTQEV